jgi:glycosyltransferase involved in cell wall biosynthesis
VCGSGTGPSEELLPLLMNGEGATMAVIEKTIQENAFQEVHHIPAARPASRPLRVLLVITGLAAGGATNVVLDIARHLNEHPGFEVHLLTGPPPPGRTNVTPLAYEMGIKTRLIPSLVNDLSPLSNLRAVAAIRQLIVAGGYDVVHTHSSVAGVVGRLAAFTAGSPVILHHVHGWPPYHEMSRTKQLLYLSLERLCASFSTRIITVSRPDIAKGLRYRICREEKLALIYNGIDLEKFQQPVDEPLIREQLRLDAHTKLVGMIGRLDRQKNPLDFIHAAAIVAKSYPNVQFLMIGDGILRKECEALISELNMSRKILLLGYRSDVARIMPLLSVVAMSSLWEGLPIAFLEAMSAGKPIVANDVDGVRDVVVPGETGYLVPPRHPDKMAERILHLLNHEAIAQEMGKLARQRSADFSVQRMVGQIESLYNELCSAVQRPVAAYG